MKYTCLIIDDEPESINCLINVLEQSNLFDKQLSCSSIVEALVILNEQPVDLIFLDMKLKEGTGTELLKVLRQRPPIIAVSAYSIYAAECYDWDIQDFIIKPVTYARLLRGLRRTILAPNNVSKGLANTQLNESSVQLSDSPSSVSLESKVYDVIFLRKGRQTERFDIQEILYIKAYTIYSKVVSKGSTVIVNEKISDIETKLSHTAFIRIHKSYLANLKRITQFSANTVWIGSTAIPIGGIYKEKVHRFLKAL